MPRSNSVPAYRFHKATGQAVVTVRTATGRRDVYLGPYNSPESKTAYARVLAERTATVPTTPADRQDLTVDEMLLPFLEYADRHYRRPDGTATTEIDEIKRSLAPVHKLYGNTLAAKFGPKALAVVRNEMVAANWCRTLVNHRIDRVKRAFRWAASQELVPVSVYEALRTLTGLKMGRTEARESDPVKPVPAEHVATTLPRLNRHVRAMVELQQLTGMRPGEVCALTLGQVDRTTSPWVYSPTNHKGAWRGKPRVIPFGPKARALLTEFLAVAGGIDTFDPAAPVFSPARARDERFVQLRAGRKTKVQPSQTSRKRTQPKKLPGARYTTHAYSNAIRVSAKKAGAPHWSPNQLRHSVATEVRREHGLEAAGAVLGHSRMSATEIYAERDLALAARIAEATG